MVQIFNLASIVTVFFCLFFSGKTQIWVQHCLEIKGYNFPRIQFVTGFLPPTVPEQLRMELQVRKSLVRSRNTANTVYLADVRRGKCKGSFVLPNSLMIVNKTIELRMFRFNTSEVFEIFVFEYNELIIDKISVAYGVMYQSMLRVSIANKATEADVFRSLGQLKPNRLKEPEMKNVSCLTFTNPASLTKYQVKVTAIDPGLFPMSYSAILLRVIGNGFSIANDYIRLTASSQKYVEQECNEERPLIIAHKYSKDTQLRVDLFDLNDYPIEFVYYELNKDGTSFFFESGTVKFDWVVKPSSSPTLEEYKKMDIGHSLKKLIFLGPVRVYTRMCEVETGIASLYEPTPITGGTIHARVFRGLCVRATGYFYLKSRQPKGFQKVVRMTEGQIRYCLLKNSFTAIPRS